MPAGSKLLLSTFLVRPSSAFVEWLAWHRMMGAGLVNVLVDRRQATAHPLLSALEAAGLVRIVPVGVDPDMKEEMHNSALRAGAVEGAESGGHGLFLGPDEYFRIHSTARTIASLMRGAGGADVMSVPVCEAGTGGHEHHVPGPVLHMARPVAVPGPGAGWRSVVRLGLFASRTPEVPVGPVTGGGPVKWVDGSGAALPEPQSRVAWARAGLVPGMARASVLRIAAPASETLLLRAQHLPPKQRPGTEALLARLTDLAASAAARAPGSCSGPESARHSSRYCRRPRPPPRRPPALGRASARPPPHPTPHPTPRPTRRCPSGLPKSIPAARSRDFTRGWNTMPLCASAAIPRGLW